MNIFYVPVALILLMLFCKLISSGLSLRSGGWGFPLATKKPMH